MRHSKIRNNLSSRRCAIRHHNVAVIGSEVQFAIKVGHPGIIIIEQTFCLVVKVFY